MKQYKDDKIDYVMMEFVMASEVSYSVTAKAYNTKSNPEKWNWSVYAWIRKTHPLFDDPEKAIDKLSFNGGANLDNLITTEPARGIKYDWQTVVKCLKIGADYNHEWDSESKSSPFDGLPTSVFNGAQELIKDLESYKEEA